MARNHAGPEVQKITVKDLLAAIYDGASDFRKAPLLSIGFAAFFAICGWLLLALAYLFKLPFLAYPLAVGFALVAPFAAVGFYAISSQLDAGGSLSLASVFAAIRDASLRDLRWMALVTGFALIIWMDIAAFLFFILIGVSGFGPEFFENLFNTRSGIIFLLTGNLIGVLLSIFVYSISVISFPMLFERDIDFVTAMISSVRVVRDNPAPMLLWCAVIGFSIGLSILSGLLALFIVLPIVGHATWHLYRTVCPKSGA